jgi:hypothetical protein
VRGKDELIFGMEMLRDGVPVGKVGGNAGDFGERAAALAKKQAVALFRHFLSQ